MDAEDKARKMIEESNLPEGFPYQTIDEIREGVKDKSLHIKAPYNSDVLYKYGNKAEKYSHNFWLSIPFVIILTSIVLAICLGNYYLLFGVLLSLIGFFMSTPFLKIRGLLYIISFGLFIFFIIKSNLTGYILSGSFLFSLWATITARDICSDTIKKISLSSLEAFNLFLRTSAIIVYDEVADKFY
jgi:hypothetical protein